MFDYLYDNMPHETKKMYYCMNQFFKDLFSPQ